MLCFLSLGFYMPMASTHGGLNRNSRGAQYENLIFFSNFVHNLLLLVRELPACAARKGCSTLDINHT